VCPRARSRGGSSQGLSRLPIIRLDRPTPGQRRGCAGTTQPSASGCGRSPARSFRTPSTAVRPLRGHSSEGRSGEDSARPAYPGTASFQASVGTHTKITSRSGPFGHEHTRNLLWGNSHAGHAKGPKILWSTESHSWSTEGSVNQREPGLPMCVSGTYDHEEVLTVPLTSAHRVPSGSIDSPVPPTGRRRVLWCTEPKARAVPSQFTCRHQEVEVLSG